MSIPSLAVIMAGGRGTRFWPRSRTLRPKQFLAMVGEDSMLEQTVQRLEPDFKPEHIFIVTTSDLAEATRSLLPMLPVGNVLVEPEGRNTAPCLALALVELERRFKTGVMVVLSADSWIGEPERFLEDVRVAASHAAGTGDLVTFGIKPSYPETGYGYIETEAQGRVVPVKAFREKPDAPTAIGYLQSGRHYWNAGMFAWTLADMRGELQLHCPEVLTPLDAWVRNGAAAEELSPAYRLTPKTSIDYALLEKSDKVAVVPATFRWSDVGSWPAVAEFHKADPQGNVAQGDVILLDSRNCAVYGGKRLIAGSGLNDLIVVDEPDALMICRREKAQDVKKIVDQLQALGRTELL